MRSLDTKEVLKRIEKKFDDLIEDKKIVEKEEGKSGDIQRDIFIKIPKKQIKNVISFIKNIQTPHFTTMYGEDQGNQISLSYVLTLFYESKKEELTLIIETEVDKENPKIESITELIPAAITTEREMQEMLGIEISNIPDDRHIYLPFDQPEEEYPWRSDEKGPSIIDLYKKEGQK